MVLCGQIRRYIQIRRYEQSALFWINPYKVCKSGNVLFQIATHSHSQAQDRAGDKDYIRQDSQIRPARHNQER